jgi:uncharacterized membrane protein YbhN (UPF0104 family)
MNFNFSILNRLIINLTKITICVAILNIIFKFNNISIDNLNNFYSINSNLFYIIIFFQVYYLLSVYRWYIILQNLGCNVRFLECLRIDSSSIVFNFLLPTGELSGELYKGYVLHKIKNIPKYKAFISLILDRGFGLIVLLLLSAPSLCYLFFLKYNNPYIILLSITFVILIYFIVKKIKIIILFLKNKFKLDLSHIKIIFVFGSLKKFFFFIIISFFSLFFLFLMILFTTDVSIISSKLLFNALLIFPIGLIINALPLTPGSIGVGSLGYLFLSIFFFGTNETLLTSGLLIYQLIFLLFGVLAFTINFLINNRIFFLKK